MRVKNENQESKTPQINARLKTSRQFSGLQIAQNYKNHVITKETTQNKDNI